MANIEFFPADRHTGNLGINCCIGTIKVLDYEKGPALPQMLKLLIYF